MNGGHLWGAGRALAAGEQPRERWNSPLQDCCGQTAITASGPLFPDTSHGFAFLS